jgi:hypothetical protein
MRGLNCAGDLNPHDRAFSPILCLSTQVGEKSPSWGFHAAKLAGGNRLVSSSYFLPGHDVRAMQTRVRQHLDIPLKFIQYVDARLAVRTRAEASGSPTGEIAYSSVASSPRQVAPGSRHPGRIWQRDRVSPATSRIGGTTEVHRPGWMGPYAGGRHGGLRGGDRAGPRAR